MAVLHDNNVWVPLPDVFEAVYQRLGAALLVIEPKLLGVGAVRLARRSENVEVHPDTWNLYLYEKLASSAHTATCVVQKGFSRAAWVHSPHSGSRRLCNT